MSTKEKTKIPIEDAPTIFFDFARHYHGGQWSTLYRINCGTMYVSDLEEVEESLKTAYEDLDEEDDWESDEGQSWGDILLRVEDELRQLRMRYC